MSFVITIYVLSRIVMASDSRQTVSLQQADEPTATPIPIISYDYI